MTMSNLQLGLIGDNIAMSRAPALYRLAGEQNGVTVRYDRLVPKEMGETFDQIFDQCPQRKYRGINVTYPYKERAAAKVRVDDPLVRAIAAVNTVLFDTNGPMGFNTDYSGFIAAYRASRNNAPGICCIIGTGGVGRALAFGLVALGATEVRLVDRDLEKAQALAEDINATSPNIRITTFADADAAASGAQGLLNGTPVGMYGYDGTPLPSDAIKGAEWAFDAVYTPVDTEFLANAEEYGLDIVSGYEMFLWQGAQAWELFSGGKPLDRAALRHALETAS
jgi:shikimate dehydrogenase